MFDHTTSTKQCETDLGENVMCLRRDVESALKSENTFHLNIYVMEDWNVGGREGER